MEELEDETDEENDVVTIQDDEQEEWDSETEIPDEDPQ